MCVRSSSVRDVAEIRPKNSETNINIAKKNQFWKGAMDKSIDAKMPAHLFRKLAKLFSRLAKLFLKLEKNLRTSYVSVQIRLTVFLIQLSYFFKPSRRFLNILFSIL